MDGKVRDRLYFRHVFVWLSALYSLSSRQLVQLPTANGLARSSLRKLNYKNNQKYYHKSTTDVFPTVQWSHRNKRPLLSIINLGRYYPDSDNWLEHTTDSFLNLVQIPLGQLTTDDVETISGLMAAWARKKSDQAALRVEALLKRVVDDWNAGNKLARVTTRMYTMAIDSWAKASCGIQAAYRANEIHNNMKRIYQHTQDESIRPTTISYNAVINSWSKCADPVSPYEAEEILKEMIHGWRVTGDDAVKPDVVSFTSCIDAWAKSGEDDAPKKALALFHLMERLYQVENEYTMKPNGKFSVSPFTRSIVV